MFCIVFYNQYTSTSAVAVYAAAEYIQKHNASNQKQTRKVHFIPVFHHMLLSHGQDSSNVNLFPGRAHASVFNLDLYWVKDYNTIK